jgi:spore coat protein U-like protein
VKTSVRCLAFLLLLWEIPAAFAACSVWTTNLAFGGYDVFAGTPLDSSGSVAVSCNEFPPPDVLITIGRSLYSGGFRPRRMKHATRPDLLDYNLYTDSSRTTVWGDGSAGTGTVTLRRVRTRRRRRPVVTPIYGRVFPQQNVSTGSYSDVLTVTIDW